MFVASGGISALVQALQDGSSRAKASAVELLLGFAMDGHDNQEWIGAAPGAIAALVDLLRCTSIACVRFSQFGGRKPKIGSASIRFLPRLLDAGLCIKSRNRLASHRSAMLSKFLLERPSDCT